MPLPYDDFREQMEAAMTLVVTLLAQEAEDIEERPHVHTLEDAANLRLMAVQAYQIAAMAAPGSAVAARAHALQRDLAKITPST